jgi:GNAT superfamily N-acetyltransferase
MSLEDASKPKTRFVVRLALLEDVPSLARHCVEMYADMGGLPSECREPLRDAAEAFISVALPRGEYVAWVAVLKEEPGRVVAGAGLHLRPAVPRLRRRGTSIEITAGPQGVVCNVYTERAWRRQGAAAAVLQALLTWAAARDVPHIFLHASNDGRQLYERLGFVPTNEMRYAGASSPAT